MADRIGKIDISQLNTPPEKHEFETAKFFADMGKDIVFLKPSDIPNVHTPDIRMDGVEWEIKCPEGSGKRTIEKNIVKAELQSNNIILDLRWIKIPEKECLSQIKRNFESRSRIRRILVITKGLRLVSFPESN